MLTRERAKLEETLAFRRQQQDQLDDEERIIQESKARLNQVKTPRELSALQRQVESTRRMAAARVQEIAKIDEVVAGVQERIAGMEQNLAQLRAKADEEKAKLLSSQSTITAQVEELRKKRKRLTDKVDPKLLRTYERIRGRLGGLAFVAASEERCTACKMSVPHLIYAQLIKGETIPHCETCGRLLYWQGHFPSEAEARAERERKAQEARKKALAERVEAREAGKTS